MVELQLSIRLTKLWRIRSRARQRADILGAFVYLGNEGFRRSRPAASLVLRNNIEACPLIFMRLPP